MLNQEISEQNKVPAHQDNEHLLTNTFEGTVDSYANLIQACGLLKKESDYQYPKKYSPTNEFVEVSSGTDSRRGSISSTDSNDSGVYLQQIN